MIIAKHRYFNQSPRGEFGHNFLAMKDADITTAGIPTGAKKNAGIQASPSGPLQAEMGQLICAPTSDTMNIAAAKNTQPFKNHPKNRILKPPGSEHSTSLCLKRL